jgi:hypothetical protein
MPPTTTPLVAGLLALMLTAPLGCKEGADDDDTTGDEVGEDPPPPKVCKSSCDQCADLQKIAFACMAFDNSFGDAEADGPLATFECIVCDNDGEASAVSTCETQAKIDGVFYTDMEAQAVPCDEPEPRPNPNPRPVQCDDWHPNERVHLAAADTWNVDREFVHELIADPSQLVECDDARMWRNHGSYRVALADSDDLLVHLGFANGDVIRSVNGYTISDPADAALAFFRLWTSTSTFTIVVLRPGVGVLTFTYNFV